MPSFFRYRYVLMDRGAYQRLEESRKINISCHHQPNITFEFYAVECGELVTWNSKKHVVVAKRKKYRVLKVET